MTDAAFISGALVPTQPKGKAAALPKPQPFGAPVFVSDCVTPLGGETLLSLLLKRLADDDQP